MMSGDEDVGERQRPRDEIILIGFSRGVFAMRCLADLVSKFGIHRPGPQETGTTVISRDTHVPTGVLIVVVVLVALPSTSRRVSQLRMQFDRPILPGREPGSWESLHAWWLRGLWLRQACFLITTLLALYLAIRLEGIE